MRLLRGRHTRRQTGHGRRWPRSRRHARGSTSRKAGAQSSAPRTVRKSRAAVVAAAAAQPTRQGAFRPPGIALYSFPQMTHDVAQNVPSNKLNMIFAVCHDEDSPHGSVALSALCGPRDPCPATAAPYLEPWRPCATPATASCVGLAATASCAGLASGRFLRSGRRRRRSRPRHACQGPRAAPRPCAITP